jgi:hypothetical protein
VKEGRRRPSVSEKKKKRKNKSKGDLCDTETKEGPFVRSAAAFEK